MKKRMACGWAIGLAVMAAGFLLAGCEETSNSSINLDPGEASLNVRDASENAVRFTASYGGDTNSAVSLIFPLEWTVSDRSLGNITSSGGASAVYTRTTKTGSNTITVRDQGDASGVAVVTQYQGDNP